MKPILAVLLFIVSSLSAQEPAPVFKSKAELVLVPVVITRDGQPIPGLKAEDFTLLHQGQREEIAVFEEISARVTPKESPALPTNTVSNFGKGETQADTVIVLLDFLNARWDNALKIRAYIRDCAKLFADTKTPVSVLLLTTKGLVQAHSFGTDPANLLQAVDAWSKKKPLDLSTDLGLQKEPNWSSTFSATSMSGTADVFDRLAVSPTFLAARQLDRAATTTQALEQISAAFGGIPGRKRLIWVSTGFPSVGDINMSGSSASYEFQMHDKIVRAWRALTTNNIVVYPIDSNAGPVNPTFGSRANTASMLEVAERTGGRTCVDLLNNCMARTLAADQHYYLLGFYLHGDQKPGWHKIKVESKTQKASIHTRTGFVVTSDKPNEKEIDRDIVVTALASPLDYTGIPLTLHWTEATSNENATVLDLEITAPAGGVIVDNNSGMINLDYLAFIRPVGKTEGQSYPKTLAAPLPPAQQKKFMEKGFTFRKQIPAPAPGSYELRVFLRDNATTKIGTVSTTLTVR